MKCSNCGASLPAKSDLCRYCGSLNDTDLRGVHFYTKNGPESDRICPRCSIKLQTINIEIDGKFYVERCTRCLGVFFDSGELEHVVQVSVDNVHGVDYHKLNMLITERQKSDFSVTYVKCPVCQKFMNRKTYGSRSGVIVDTCKEHGIWLDGGELGPILRWSKAGGQKHNQARSEQKKRLQADQKRFAARLSGDSREPSTKDEDLLKTVFALFS